MNMRYLIAEINHQPTLVVVNTDHVVNLVPDLTQLYVSRENHRGEKRYVACTTLAMTNGGMLHVIGSGNQWSDYLRSVATFHWMEPSEKYQLLNSVVTHLSN